MPFLDLYERSRGIIAFFASTRSGLFGGRSYVIGPDYLELQAHGKTVSRLSHDEARLEARLRGYV